MFTFIYFNRLMVLLAPNKNDIFIYRRTLRAAYIAASQKRKFWDMFI